MAAPGTIRSGAGFRHAKVFPLSASGYPNAPDTTAYEGISIVGARALLLSDPGPRQIVHVGDDHVFQLDALPPSTPITGSLSTGAIQDDIDDDLGDDNIISVAEARLFGIGTNNQGNENQVGILAYRQTLDTGPSSATRGARRWEFRIFPKALLIPQETGFAELEEKPYTLLPQYVGYHLWQTAFALGTEGFTRAQGLRGVSQYKPKIVTFLADGSTTTFTLPTNYPAQSADKVAVWDQGTLQTTGYTASTTNVAFSTAPTSANFVVVFYEHDVEEE